MIARPTPNLEEIQKAVRVIVGQGRGRVVEVRAFDASEATWSGYYNGGTFSQDVFELSSREDIPAVYWTIQETDPALLVAGRANNIYYQVAKTTDDEQVKRYLYLPIDCDPVRLPDTSSTDDEKKAALEVAMRVIEYFRARGVNCILGDSGNGYHVLVPLDIINQNGTNGLIRKVLKALNARFGTSAVNIDEKVFNPSRILKIYGTAVRKGPHTDERPWRVSRLVDVPENLSALNHEQVTVLLANLTKDLPQEKQAEINEKKKYVPPAPGTKITEERNNAVRDYAWHVWYNQPSVEPDVEDLKTKVYQFNQNFCVPPLGEDELDRTVLSSTPKKQRAKDKQVYSSATPNPRSSPTAESTSATPLSMEQIRELVDRLIFSSPDVRKKNFGEWGLPINSAKAVNVAVDAIYRHLQLRGTFYFADSVGYLLMNEDRSRLYKVSPEDAQFANLMIQYGIYPEQKEFKRLGKLLNVKAKVEGIPGVVRYSSYYSKDTEAFYFAEKPGWVIKGDGYKLERLPNGHDGILFQFDEKNTADVDLTNLPTVNRCLCPDTNSAMMELLFKDLVFKPSLMTDREKTILLTTYEMLLMLPGIVEGKPILQFPGPTGCGKSFALKRMGRAIVGPSFGLQKMPTKDDQFENMLVNNDLLFFDNVGSRPGSSILDMICSSVTGYDVTRRELFTTMEQVKVPSKATIAMSCLTSVLNSSEHANRSIVLALLKRGDDNLDEDSMLEEFDAARGSLIMEIIVRAQAVLRAIKEQKAYRPRVENRMAGVAILIRRIAHSEGWDEEGRGLLSAWHQEQLNSALENDDVAERLTAWMRNSEWKADVYTAGQLDSALKTLTGMGEASWKNAISLALHLRKSEESYARRYGLKIGEDKHTKSLTFTFRPSTAFLADIREGIESKPGADVTFDNQSVQGSTVAIEAEHAEGSPVTEPKSGNGPKAEESIKVSAQNRTAKPAEGGAGLNSMDAANWSCE